MEPIRLSYTARATPVVLEMDGANLELELREMNAAGRDRYLDLLSDRMRLDTDGKPCGVKKFGGLQADLLCLCLFKSDGKTITKEEVQKWPASIVTELFRAAQKLNALDQAEASAVGEQIKND